MALTRRGLLAGILGACVAPAIVHNPMRIWVPREDETWGIRYLDLNGDHSRLQEVLNNAMRDAAELTAFPRIAIDPAWPGGDRTAMVTWHVERGRFTIIDDVRIWPVTPNLSPLLQGSGR
jgi:hypothetical protein